MESIFFLAMVTVVLIGWIVGCFFTIGLVVGDCKGPNIDSKALYALACLPAWPIVLGVTTRILMDGIKPGTPIVIKEPFTNESEKEPEPKPEPKPGKKLIRKSSRAK